MIQNNFDIFKKLNLNNHIKNTFGIVFEVNSSEAKIIRHKSADSGDFGDEELDPEIVYTVKLNINPVRVRNYAKTSESTVKVYSHEVYGNCDEYPKFGVRSDGKIINEPMTKILTTDTIEFNGEKYMLSDNIEDVCLNDEPILWQHFFMKLLVSVE